MASAGLMSQALNGPQGHSTLKLVVALVALLVALQPSPLGAETLREALIAAYQHNPRLDAERARLRATDESVPQAKSGYRPRAELEGDVGHQTLTTKPRSLSDGSGGTAGYGVTVRQDVFNGFRTMNSVREAESNVRAGRENLRTVEQQTLLEAVTAYADVIRDTALIRLRENAVAVLTKDLQAAEARRSVREVTRTDVAQAQARRARAVSQLDLAKANLRTARAIYERVMGRPANGLMEPALPRRLLPPSVDEAIKTGEREHPNVIAALFREKAARHTVDRIWGELLPSARLEATYGTRYDPSKTVDEQTSGVISGRVTVPLYEGGETQARVRAAKHSHVARLQEIEQARAETQTNVVTAWSRYQAADAQLRSDRVQVMAAKTALEGTREEERVGQRTLLDVLNAEQELLDAEVQQVVTKRDLIVASFTVLSAIGRLNPDELKLGAEQYDAEAHYNEVTAKWWGVSITHPNGRKELLERVDDWGAEDRYAMRQRPGSCEGLGRQCAEPALPLVPTTSDPLDRSHLPPPRKSWTTTPDDAPDVIALPPHDEPVEPGPTAAPLRLKPTAATPRVTATRRPDATAGPEPKPAAVRAVRAPKVEPVAPRLITGPVPEVVAPRLRGQLN